MFCTEIMDKEFARGIIMKSRQFWIASEFGDKFKTEWPKSTQHRQRYPGFRRNLECVVHQIHPTFPIMQLSSVFIRIPISFKCMHWVVTPIHQQK